MPICIAKLNASSFRALCSSSNEVNSWCTRRSESCIVEIRVLAYYNRKAAPRRDAALHANHSRLDPWRGQNRRVFAVKSHESEITLKKTASVFEEGRASEDENAAIIDDQNWGGVGRRGGGRGGGGGGGGEDEEGKEFGSVFKFARVMRECERRGASLPWDMMEAARTIGIREVILDRYLYFVGLY